MGRIKIEDIQSSLSQINWKVISHEYRNLDNEMSFKCPEGHTVYSTWRKIRNKAECPICKNNYVEEGEEMCAFCAEELKREWQNDDQECQAGDHGSVRHYRFCRHSDDRITVC